MATNPEELLIALVLAIIGISFISGQAKPNSVQDLVPHWMVIIWGIELAIGGLSVVIGMFQPGFRLEIAGLIVLAFASPIYAVVALAFAGTGGAFTAFFLTGYAVACWTRARSLMRVIRLDNKYSIRR